MANVGDDVVFTVTGEGAKDLQARLIRKGLQVTPTENGGFTISNSNFQTEAAQDDSLIRAIKDVLYKQAGFKPNKIAR